MSILYKNKRVIIFGAGYIGGEVARRAVAGGACVIALTRNEQAAEKLREAGVGQVVVARLDSGDWHEQIEPQADYVLNSVSSAGGGLQGYRESYVGGMRSISEWAADAPAHALGTAVYTSSTGVYAQSNGEIVREDTPVGGTEKAEILLEAEKALQQTPAFNAWCVLRLAGIYGPGRHHLLDNLRCGEDTLPGGGSHTLNLIHRDDACSAIEAAWQAPQSQLNRAYNIADNTHPTKQEVALWLCTQLDRPPVTFDLNQSPDYENRKKRPFREIPDRKICNKSATEKLGWKPLFESYQQGYREILRNPHY